MPNYEYRCDQCLEVTSVYARISDSPKSTRCEHCGSDGAHRILSRPAVHRSNLSKVERLDPKYDQLIDRAMRNTPLADPDRYINRRGDISKGVRDDSDVTP